MKTINTDTYSAYLRGRSIILPERRILVARLTGSQQENDLAEPVNCKGFGRLRHFRLDRYDEWSSNPLPILPAAKALGRQPNSTLRAQVFQNAACNWRCWYCYVDFDRLAADTRVAEYFTADELIELYLAEQSRADVIDLSGGQPDLTPEWLIWTMEALTARGLESKIFLWSDDNLSNRYYWQYLNERQRQAISQYELYARVACFKGYDPASFEFNTRAAPELFARQLAIFRELLNEGLDLYAYVTLTAPPHSGLGPTMKLFVDQLQSIHRNLPLRTIPLKIDLFAPTRPRVREQERAALAFQHDVHGAWCEELTLRFSDTELAAPICDVSLG